MTAPTVRSGPWSGRPTPSRRRTGRLILAAVVLLPVAELALAIRVGQVIGAGPTIGLLLLGMLAGTVVLRRVGLSTLRRLSDTGETAVAAGGVAAAPPAPAATALLVVAGLLLIFPGFLTDAAGLVLLVPAVRRGLARRLGAALARRLGVRSRLVQGTVVDGSVVEARVVDVVDVVVEPGARGAEPASPPRALPPATPGARGTEPPTR